MIELYLIAHKVRGEPAFDIACKMQIGEEEGWIIPTSGWRAYPYDVWLLKDLCYSSGVYDDPSFDYPVYEIKNFDLSKIRDHFAATAAPAERKLTTLNLADLGL